ncbi:hypothetical protein P171DRAFT_448337 [Karstenula rhodostoma CBS 690.94]|uniref:Uncharacterized protein n=1 Tax=Karstenula rhodostoma CBS 690.94 TaxID=1392251 RepID=A0A9P4U7Z7_9PLEO|nr:hypothetical protein P171DRAFT_448337 [Karstenula rhodostoma CBS 690.94]
MPHRSVTAGSRRCGLGGAFRLNTSVTRRAVPSPGGSRVTKSSTGVQNLSSSPSMLYTIRKQNLFSFFAACCLNDFGRLACKKLGKWQREVANGKRAPSNSEEVQWLRDFCRAMGTARKPGDPSTDDRRLESYRPRRDDSRLGGRAQNSRRDERSTEDRSRGADRSRRKPADRSRSPLRRESLRYRSRERRRSPSAIYRGLDRRDRSPLNSYRPRGGRRSPSSYRSRERRRSPLNSYRPEAPRGRPSYDSMHEHKTDSPLRSRRDERGTTMAQPSHSKGASFQAPQDPNQAVGTKRKHTTTSSRQIEPQKRASTSGATNEEPQSIMSLAAVTVGTHTPHGSTDAEVMSSQVHPQVTSETQPSSIPPRPEILSIDSQVHVKANSLQYKSIDNKQFSVPPLPPADDASS